MSSFRLVKIHALKAIVRNFALTKFKRPFSKTNSLVGPLEEHRIIPELLWKAPENQLVVKYSGDKMVRLGSKMTPEDTKHEPVCVQWQSDPKCWYCLYMADLDVPSRNDSSDREFQHWLIGNIRGNNLRGGNYLTPYIGPLPRADTGLHRIIFLLFKQKKCQDFKEPTLSSQSLRGRKGFNIRHFKVQYCMEDPLAVNFFFAENDCHVNKMLEKFRQREE